MADKKFFNMTQPIELNEDLEAKKKIYSYIDSLPVKAHLVELVILDMSEKEELAHIEGIATGGSISINGASAVRRTGSLNMVVPNGYEGAPEFKVTKVNKSLISLNKRVKVNIGIVNSGHKYKDIDVFWFKMGVFVIKNAQISNNTQGINISLTLSDKMSLLNGDIGGVITGATTHSPLNVENSPIKENVSIHQLIESLVCDYGGLPLSQVKISDLGTDRGGEESKDGRYIYRLTTSWQGENPLYIYPIEYTTNEKGESVPLRYEVTTDPNAITYNGVREFFQFDSVGYMMDELYYPDNLTSKGGDTIVSVLDKIKNVLGNFEYFFDIDGVFRFQQIRNGLNSQGSEFDDFNDALNDEYFANSQASIFDLTNGNRLITSYSNSPNYTQIKNDFVIWGKSNNEVETPIRYRLMITELANNEGSFGAYYCQFYVDEFDVVRAASVVDAEDPNDNNATIPADWRHDLYLRYIRDNIQTPFAKELIEEFPKIYSVDVTKEKGWKYTVGTVYSNLKYYLEAINPASIKSEDMVVKELSIENIGQRTKVVNHDKVNCIFKNEPVDVLFVKDEKDKPKEGAYAIVSPEIWDKLTSKVIAVSAYSVIRGAIHEYIAYNNSISISAIPMYYLEPNIKVTVEDENSDIHGGYIISLISIPLGVDGSMSISAKAAIERL